MAKKAPTRRKPKAPPADFHKQTVLFSWALDRLGVGTLDQFRKKFNLDADSPTGVGEETRHHVAYTAIANRLRADAKAYGTAAPLDPDTLRRYEDALLDDTASLNAARRRAGQPAVAWQYFQYLALLLTELYLDRYFEDAEGLRNELNAHIDRHNTAAPEHAVAPFPTVEPARKTLNRLAFWCATGSGKTLLMHVHLRQFRRHHARAAAAGRWPPLDQTLLVTPSKSLSAQHAEEFAHSGVRARAAGEAGQESLFAGVDRPDVAVLEVHRFLGGKTEAFEGCNLVFVDEGHRGLSGGDGGAWAKVRDDLADGGFSFEYSATFKEAVAGDADLTQRYARAVLIDYAYREFYADGFGKDFNILNLEQAEDREATDRYLTVALLLFHQQLRVWEEAGGTLDGYGLDKPLWVFVGHTVAGRGGVGEGDTASDVVSVLHFLAGFVGERGRSVEVLRGLLSEGFVDAKGRDLLQGRLPAIPRTGDAAADAAALFEDVMTRVFQSPGGGGGASGGGGGLAVQVLRAAEGELAVSVGEAEPFAVVNVGNPVVVRDLAGALPGGVVRVKEDDGHRASLFTGISRPGSPVNLLLGSRKFTEGWNSHRVSSIGLMNLGKTEGAQIVQLFGRGVRLRGYGGSLRRSGALTGLPEPRPRHLRVLETLQVTGVKASYMDTFRSWLRAEVPGAVDRRVWELPVVRTVPDRPRLKTLRLAEKIDGVRVEGRSAFDRLGPVVALRPPDPGDGRDARLLRSKVVLNWMPRVRGVAAEDLKLSEDVGAEARLPEQTLGPGHLAALDVPELVFGLERMKTRRGLRRLAVDAASVRATLADPGWYTLHALAAELDPERLENRDRWQGIAAQLLERYAVKLHAHVRGLWESPYLEVVEVEADETNFIDRWELESTDAATGDDDVEEVDRAVAQIREAVAAVEAEGPEALSFHRLRLEVLAFGGHLYQPLLRLEKSTLVRVKPVALNEGEADFVTGVAAWCQRQAAGGPAVHLLRNQSQTGLGFFQAGNFFPDFLLWVCDASTGRQHLCFLDPKGTARMTLDDPKVQFATRDVPKLERRVQEQCPELTIDAYLLSVSGTDSFQQRGGVQETRERLGGHHVLRMSDAGWADDLMSRLVERLREPIAGVEA